MPRLCSNTPDSTCDFASCSPITNEVPVNPTGVPGLVPVSVCGSARPDHTGTLADGTSVVIDMKVTEFMDRTGTPFPEPHVVVYACELTNEYGEGRQRFDGGECWAFDGRDVVEDLVCGTPPPTPTPCNFCGETP